MEKIIEKRLSSIQISKELSLTSEQEQYTLQLRKIRLESQLLKRRLAGIKTKYGTSLDEIEISSELKTEEYINKIINSPSYEEIFVYINEIYNTTNYQPNLFKYGIFLLKKKLLKNEPTNKNIPSLIQNGFFDISKKIFQYVQIQIDKSPSDEIEDLIYDLYLILISYSYYGNEKENAPLISEEYLSYHYFLLKNESNDENISSIITLFCNLVLDSSTFASIIIEYRNEDLLELIIQYILSGIKHNKHSIVTDSSYLLFLYIELIKTDKSKEIKESIIEKIFNIFLDLIHCKSTYRYAIFSISKISSISPIIFDSILHNFDVFEEMISYNYNDDANKNDNSGCLFSFIDIIANVFRNNKDKHYDELYVLLELNLFDFITNILQEYSKENKIKTECLKAIYSICDCDKRFIVYMINNNVPLITVLIKLLEDPYYIIRDKVIDIFQLMTMIDSFNITLSLVSNGLLKMIIDLIKPELTKCLDKNIILKCLNIIKSIFLTGEWIKTIHNNNSYAVKFENMGGKDILENYLGNPNEDIYLTSQLIIDTFYN